MGGAAGERRRRAAGDGGSPCAGALTLPPLRVAHATGCWLRGSDRRLLASARQPPLPASGPIERTSCAYAHVAPAIDRRLLARLAALRRASALVPERLLAAKAMFTRGERDAAMYAGPSQPKHAFMLPPPLHRPARCLPIAAAAPGFAVTHSNLTALTACLICSELHSRQSKPRSQAGSRQLGTAGRPVCASAILQSLHRNGKAICTARPPSATRPQGRSAPELQ